MEKFKEEMIPVMLVIMFLFSARACSQVKMKDTTSDLHEKYEGFSEFYAFDACFWCTEGIWESLEGVEEAISGYGGGKHKNSTYKYHGDNAEGNKVIYNSKKISYKDLVDAYFDGHSHGKSPDRGQSYRAIIFYANDTEKAIVNKRYKEELDSYGKFNQEIKHIDDVNWVDAENYHQDYIKRLENGERVPNSRYGNVESIPRRDRALKRISVNKKKKLNAKAHFIMVQKGTERPFSSPLNREKRSGTYRSQATGDILFVSSAKFSSGTGWLSFDSTTENVTLGRAEQGGYEVIEKSNGYHLGHLFKGEGFTSKNMRYCINGAALEFIPDVEED